MALTQVPASMMANGGVPSFDGIKFQAAQSASSDANTLDDYEEGTWTPALTLGNGNTGLTYSARSGRYTKVGNLVTVTGIIQLSNKGSSTGLSKVTGLPFTIASDTIYQGGASGYTGNFSTRGPAIVYADPGTTNIVPYEPVTSNYIFDTNFTNSSTFSFTMTYIAA